MIGWYAHHHGAGHIARLQAIRPHLDDVVAFSSRPAPDVRHLPLDVAAPRSPRCATATVSDVWHYAPIGIAGLRNRMGAMAAWVTEADPDLFVVDVSVEVAALMRLLSVPTLVMRQHGRRDDLAHQRCYDDAAELLAPFPEWLEDPATPGDVRERTTYSGGFSRFDGRMPDRAAAREMLRLPMDERLVVVLGGADAVDWPVGPAARATRGWRWQVLSRGVGPADNVARTWVEDPSPWLAAADVVVGHTGHNVVMETAAADRPLITIPLPRPFDEQRRKAALLGDAGVCLVCPTWPTPQAWGGLLEAAVSLDPSGRRRLVDGAGSVRAAQVVAQAATEWGRSS